MKSSVAHVARQPSHLLETFSAHRAGCVARVTYVVFLFLFEGFRKMSIDAALLDPEGLATH